MNITQNLTLDLTKRAAFQYVNAKQGDNGSRFVKITLTDGGVNYRPPAGSAATFRAQKPDGTMVLNQAVVNDDGTVTVELTQQTLAVSGDVAADVCLTDNGGAQLSSVSFIIHVENAPTGEQIDSTNEFLKLLEIIERAELVTGDFESALDQLDSMKNEAIKASASAQDAAKSATSASTSASQSALDAQNAADHVHLTISSELEKAKNSGEFDGPKGDKGDKGDGFSVLDDGHGNITIMSSAEVVGGGKI